MLALVTDNEQKLAECAQILGRHGARVERWPKERFDERSLAARFEAEPKLEGVLRETSELRRADTGELVTNWRDPSLALVSVRNVGRLVAWTRADGGGVQRDEFESAVDGWLDPVAARAAAGPVFDWDAAFRTRALGKSYHELRELGLKHSARDRVLSRFVTARLYLPERADLLHHPQRPTQTVDFSDAAGRFLREQRWLGALPLDRPGVGRLLRSVAADGVFFRAAQSRRERNYWLPGLNAGIPLTAKRDAVHEVTFLVHDFMHFAQPDLVFTGDFGGDVALARNVYCAWRMLSEAASLVLADMLFVRELAEMGVEYDFGKRRIYPLSECMAVDPGVDFVGAMRSLVSANAGYALLGDASGFAALARPGLAEGRLEGALARYCEKYEGYFRADYRWTAANFDEMARRGEVFARWASLVGPARIERAGLFALGDVTARLRERDPRALETHEGTVAVVLDEVLAMLERRATEPAREDPAGARERAFRRWVLGQCMMFAAWDFLPRSRPIAEAVLGATDGPVTDELIVRVRARMDAHIDDLRAADLISDDDQRTWNGVFPLFEPRFVAYERKDSAEPSLADAARACFSRPGSLGREAPRSDPSR